MKESVLLPHQVLLLTDFQAPTRSSVRHFDTAVSDGDENGIRSALHSPHYSAQAETHRSKAFLSYLPPAFLQGAWRPPQAHPEVRINLHSVLSARSAHVLSMPEQDPKIFGTVHPHKSSCLEFHHLRSYKIYNSDLSSLQSCSSLYTVFTCGHKFRTFLVLFPPQQPLHRKIKQLIQRPQNLKVALHLHGAAHKRSLKRHSSTHDLIHHIIIQLYIHIGVIQFSVFTDQF